MVWMRSEALEGKGGLRADTWAASASATPTHAGACHLTPEGGGAPLPIGSLPFAANHKVCWLGRLPLD